MANKNKTIYIPHIPKCGGSTIHSYLEKSKRRIFWDYDHPPSYRNWYHEKCKIRNSEYKLLDFSPFDFVFGHYPIERYNHKNNVVLLLRHPVERLVSHFNYYKYLFSEDNKIGIAKNPIIKDVKNGMKILDFAHKVKANSFYKSYIDYSETDRFLLVGFMSNIKKFYLDFEKICGFEEGSLSGACKKRVNKFKESLSDTDLSRLDEYLKVEIEYYCRQKEIWDK